MNALCLDDLLSALQQLDILLEYAVKNAQTAYGTDPATDPYRGLYISQDDIERDLVREPGISPLLSNEVDLEKIFAEQLSSSSTLTNLYQSFHLSLFDLILVLIALAPEIDLRYERIYAYLQDDVTRKRPSVDLALNLLCASASLKLNRLSHFATDAPLVRQGLLVLLSDPNQIQPPLLAHYLKLDEQIIRYLLGEERLDSRLARFCQLRKPGYLLEHLSLSIERKQAFATLTEQAYRTQHPLRFYFYGSEGVGKSRAAEAIANHLGVPILTADLAMLQQGVGQGANALQLKLDFDFIVRLLFREAKLHNAIVYLSGMDEILSYNQYGVYQQLLAALSQSNAIIILAGKKPCDSDTIRSINAIPVGFTIPDFAQRRAYWQASSTAMGMRLDEEQIDVLSDRFRLTPEQIDGAIATACNKILWTRAASNEPQAQTSLQSDVQNNLQELFAATRMQSGHDLTSLARKITPKHTWDNIILPANQLKQLREVCNQVKYHHIVCNEWGFDQTLSLGKGINVLFSGSPGTGKTMAAEVIANELQLDTYKIDLSQIVSKYIGETEKNLDRVFTAAENANAILLFDEADALFGKRSEVKDAHDRYANLEVAYLLQKMEEYEGITILTTNLRQNLDEAFTRRIRFIIEFPLPEADNRLQIWQRIFPKQTPLEEDVDLLLIAQKFQLAGGSIRNIAVAAAFLAAEEGNCVGMKHLLQATKREFQKMGRLINEEDFISHKRDLNSSRLI
jgi:SpoVK/Ycf46/Vps4 family AAA+-type ATPase